MTLDPMEENYNLISEYQNQKVKNLMPTNENSFQYLFNYRVNFRAKKVYVFIHLFSPKIYFLFKSMLQ